MARRPISLSLRFSVYARDGHTCQYCGRRPPEVELQLDHVYPVALGGTNAIDNLLTACRECNIGKGARDPGLAMACRPATVGERLLDAKIDAAWWAELAFWNSSAMVKALMWELAAKAGDDGVVLVLRRHGPARQEVETLLGGLVAVGAIRIKEKGEDEWWLAIEHDRGRADDQTFPFRLSAAGPIREAPSAAEVY
ncbi:MAG: HNH endonuclease [Reyranella sp.]